MTAFDQQQLGKTLWAIADQLRGAMNADDFRDYMLSFLFALLIATITKLPPKKNWVLIIQYLTKKTNEHLLSVWYADNEDDVEDLKSRCAGKCTM